MSFERSFEPWEEMQRHGLDLADRLAQGFTGLLHSPPAFPWTPATTTTHKIDLIHHYPSAAVDGVSAILDIGNRLGQAGSEIGACVNGVVQQFFRQFPVPFRQEEVEILRPVGQLRMDLGGRREEVVEMRVDEELEEFGLVGDRISGRELSEMPATAVGGLEGLDEEEGFDFDLRTSGRFGKPQGSVNITSTYDSRTNGIESSLVARGDLWRVEASHDSSTSRNETSPLYLLQLGPVLFVRDTTLLLPVHLSKQHLLWYGYDRKNGMHSLCPAVWSEHRRWLLMSMICFNPFACTFMDLQFPNGQLTYVAGEGFTTSAFLPAFGGLLQVQGQYPGETRFSFSCKNKSGTRITPMVQWPDQSFSLGIAQTLAWRRSGLMLQPSVQCSICPTFGGSNPGLHTELVHSLKEKLSVSCGYSCTNQPSAFASVALGRSKSNGNVGSSGVVVRVETPLTGMGRPSFSVQLNSGVEF